MLARGLVAASEARHTAYWSRELPQGQMPPLLEGPFTGPNHSDSVTLGAKPAPTSSDDVGSAGWGGGGGTGDGGGRRAGGAAVDGAGAVGSTDTSPGARQESGLSQKTRRPVARSGEPGGPAVQATCTPVTTAEGGQVQLP